MNRTISCTVNEEAVKCAFAFLARNSFAPTTLAAVTRMCVELVASQLQGSPTGAELEVFEQMAVTGRVSRAKPTYNHVSLNASPNGAQTECSQYAQHSTGEQLWWQKLGCCSAEDGIRFTTFLREQNLTPEQCSYTDWQKHQIMKSRSSAEASNEPNVCPAELTQLAAERAEREAAERQVLAELAKAQQQAFATNEEA